MSNPFTPYLEMADEKFRREREFEATLTLKRKHLMALRQLLFPELCLARHTDPERHALLLEIDHKLYEALQLV